MYSAKAIANLILEQAKKRNIAVSQMKLQKLCYYAHGHWLGYYGQPLLNETVEAWRYGPVIRSLYDEFKQFGNKPITQPARELEYDFEAGYCLIEVEPPGDARVHEMVDQLLNTYGKISAERLANMTHAPDGPWDRTWSKNPGILGQDIDNKLIQEHFEKYGRATPA